MLSLDHAERVESVPFPLLRQRGFLPIDFYNQLIAEFPTDEEAESFTRVMGNRRRISSDDLSFYAFLEGRPAWQKLYDMVNSRDFVDRIQERFRTDIEAWGGDTTRRWEFDPDRMQRTARDPFTLWERVKLKLGWKPYADSKPLPADARRVFVHFDISAAYDGYSRVVHRDSAPRIAAFLIYFSSAEETGGEGGEFGVHKLKEANPTGYPREPAEEDCETVELLRPEENLFVMFLSCANAYHSVPRVAGAHGTRRFIYVGLSSEPAFWTTTGASDQASTASKRIE